MTCPDCKSVDIVNGYGALVTRRVVERCERHTMEPPPVDKSWITMEPVSGSKPKGKLRRFFDA